MLQTGNDRVECPLLIGQLDPLTCGHWLPLEIDLRGCKMSRIFSDVHSPSASRYSQGESERERGQRMGHGSSRSLSSVANGSSGSSHTSKFRQKLRHFRRRSSHGSRQSPTSSACFKLVSADDFTGIALLTLISVLPSVSLSF